MTLLKNKIYIIFIVIISTIFLSSCGYKKINQLNKQLIHIQKVEIVGDNRIGFNLKTSLLMNSTSNSANKVNIKINISKKKTIKEKDSTNKISKYNMKLDVFLEISDLDQNKIVTRNFKKEREINVSTSHSGTVQNEKKAIENLTDLLAEDISNYLNLYYRN